MSSIVKRAGDTFQLDGKTWRARGVNVYQLLESTAAEREARLNEIARLGYNTVRFWAFSKFEPARPDFWPNLGAVLAQADRLGSS